MTAKPTSHKGKIAARLAAAFDVVGFGADVRSARVNIATLGAVGTQQKIA
jgi:hypothetical protein